MPFISAVAIDPPEYEHSPLCEDGYLFYCEYGWHHFKRNDSAPVNWCYQHNSPGKWTVDCVCAAIEEGMGQ